MEIKEIKISGNAALLEKVVEIINDNFEMLDGAVDDFYYGGEEGEEMHLEIFSR